MKKGSLILVVLALGMFLFSGSASALTMESTPVLIVDGIDTDTTVTVGIMHNTRTQGFDFGYLSSGSFTTLLTVAQAYGEVTFTGGDVVNFAVKDIPSGNVFALGEDALGNNYCTLDFSGGPIDANHSQHPVVSSGYWNNVTLQWGVPTPLLVQGDGRQQPGFDLIAEAQGSQYDGLAPAPASPEPSTMLLFGSGLLGLAGLGRRFRKNL